MGCCKKICFPCHAFAECMRKTVVPIIALAWINCICICIAAFTPYWLSGIEWGRDFAEGPLVRCQDTNETGPLSFECEFRDLSNQSDIATGASFTILFAVIGFFACGILGSLLNCACFEASRVCFIGVIIVTSIVSGILTITSVVLYSIEHGDAFNRDDISAGEYDWGYYMALVECLLVIPSVLIYTVFCACCGVCWTCQGVLCCCC